ncbi:MAG: HD domain-containing phosphohydrolase [Sulfurimonas sp.]
MDNLPKDVLLRMLERERLAREETEHILERTTLELYRTNQQLHTYLNDNELLLRQYKDAVDEGTIVSKTDDKGLIVYVNEEFCRISGYTKEELLGKPHKVVRHDDMPSEVYREMWERLKRKQSWKGILKNKTKQGKTYIVQAMIKPILNSEENIVEYIAIRQDITEIYNLQNEISETQREILEKMGELAESRSQETGYHVKRVAEYSALLAKLYGLDDEEVELLKMASPMHDIGKIAISDSILLKPGRLTEEEFEVMKTHAQKGHKLFVNSKRELLKAAAIVAHEHHEKYDGTGYPRGLKGEDIHIYGRITALADVFDALGSKRVYKEAWDDEKIFALFKQERAKQFDPVLVDLFFEYLDEFLVIRDRLQES